MSTTTGANLARTGITSGPLADVPFRERTVGRLLERAAQTRPQDSCSPTTAVTSPWSRSTHGSMSSPGT